MKLTICLFFLLLSNFPVGNLQPVVNAFKSFDTEKIAQYLDDNVEISILDDSILSNKMKAKSMLSKFFKEHSTTSFKVIHKIQSENGCSGSFIANMKSVNKTYRLFVLVTVAENKKILIQEINIREK